MGALTRQDLTVIEGEARVSSRRLGQALGFARLTNFHRLVRQHLDELADLGGLSLFKEQKSGRGRPGEVYFLNEHQSIAVSMWAETPAARSIRREIIDLFVAYRRGDAYEVARQRQVLDPFAVQAARTRAAADHVGALARLDDATARLTHLPIWKNGRRPRWWSNVALREFLTAAHRQMTLAEARAAAARRFGADAPSLSGLHRYWAKLDTVFGPKAGAR